MAALSGHEGGGGRGLAGAALLGQESNGIRLKRDVTINMLLDGACGKIVRLKRDVTINMCWMGRVAKSWGEGGHGVCHGGRRRTTMGSSPDAGMTAT